MKIPNSVKLLGLAAAGALSVIPRVQAADVPLRTLELSTGQGEAVVRESMLWTPLPAAPDRFEFEIGFSTDEDFGPGRAFDAFTLTLQSPSQEATAVLVTLDAAGPTWRPVTPGGLSLAPDSLEITQVDLWHGVSAPKEHRWTYHGSFELPGLLRNQSLKLTVSLFDNQDAEVSSGYVQVASIPEPGAVGLAGFGVVVWAAWAWLRGRRAGGAGLSSPVVPHLEPLSHPPAVR